MFSLSAYVSCIPVHAQPESALDHPAIREILAMVEAGVGDEVIVARIRQMENIPALSGEEIAELKRKAVSDRILLELVEWRRARKKEGPDIPSTRSGSKAKLRVILESSFPVSYYEVAVDSQIVATHGEKYEGLSEPGRALRQPRLFRIEESGVAYEEEIEPGEHRVLVGFEVSRVEKDRRDDWMEYSRQRYVSSGVESREGEGTDKAWGANQAAICRAEKDQVCVVTAQFGRSSPTRFGGLPVYSVTYLVEVSHSAAEPKP